MKPEALHWSEEAQARHDRRLATNHARGQALIFRDFGIQARNLFEFNERIAGRWP